MLRAMVFIDHFNFDIAVKNLYRLKSLPFPRLDYSEIPKMIGRQLGNVDIVKTMLFISRPDDFLMQQEYVKKAYDWAKSLASMPFFEVIEGRYLARATEEGNPLDLANKASYFMVEKGTDVNFSSHALSKAFYNSYDVGIFISADTDYLSVYSMIRNIGKLVVVAQVAGQNIRNLILCIDHHILLKYEDLERCLRPDKPNNGSSGITDTK